MAALLSQFSFLEKVIQILALSQLRICSLLPPLLSFDPVFMGNGECAIYYGRNSEKVIRFLFFHSIQHTFHRQYKLDQN